MYLKEQLSGFVPQEAASEIIKNVVRGSSVLRLSKVEPMNSDRKKFNVLVDGAGAYWVGEGERRNMDSPGNPGKKACRYNPRHKRKACGFYGSGVQRAYAGYYGGFSQSH